MSTTLQRVACLFVFAGERDDLHAGHPVGELARGVRVLHVYLPALLRGAGRRHLRLLLARLLRALLAHQQRRDTEPGQFHLEFKPLWSLRPSSKVL